MRAKRMETTANRAQADYFIRAGDGATIVKAYCDTVDDLDERARALVLYLIFAARRGPLGATMWNIYTAHSKDIRRRVQENTEVRELTNWRTRESRVAEE